MGDKQEQGLQWEECKRNQWNHSEVHGKQAQDRVDIESREDRKRKGGSDPVSERGEAERGKAEGSKQDEGAMSEYVKCRNKQRRGCNRTYETVQRIIRIGGTRKRKGLTIRSARRKAATPQEIGELLDQPLIKLTGRR